ncbi:MAG TPA: alpha/beta fold hydrolase [Kofleriaceae bacterium]|nr:alpha/beta fold hydrolase [Kofleriaceae bacterium]
MRNLLVLAPVGLAILAGCSSSRSNTPLAPLPPDPPKPGTGDGSAGAAETKRDGGRLIITQGGAPAGAEAFEIRQRGDELVIETHAEMTVMGQQLRGRGQVITDMSYRPLRGESSHDVDGVKVEATLSGGPDALQLAIRAGGQPARAEKAAGAVDVYADNTSFAQLAPLCARGGDGGTALVMFPGTKLTIGPARSHDRARVLPVDIGGSLTIDVFCDGDRLLGLDIPLAGLTATREGADEAVAALRRKPRTKPELPAGLVELDRTVEVKAKGVEPATLACSLLVPASHAEVKARAKKGPTAALPAVAFITGSGSQDRDEDSYGPGGLKLAIFKVMAIELGKAGIASLRCDDRGSGKSTGSFEKAVLETFTADTAATVAALRAEPAIDPARVGLIGHSEGGIVAPLVASRDPKVRALVLMAGTGRPLDVILLEQLRRGLERSGRPADEVEQEMARSTAILAAIAAGKPLPDDIDEREKKQWEDSRAWMASHIKHDPAKIAAKLSKVSVLIAQGDTDRQVAVADADALAAAFAKARNKQAQKKIYAGLNHLFARSTTGEISEYADPDARVDEGFLTDVVGFLRRSL